MLRLAIAGALSLALIVPAFAQSSPPADVTKTCVDEGKLADLVASHNDKIVGAVDWSADNTDKALIVQAQSTHQVLLFLFKAGCLVSNGIPIDTAAAKIGA